MASNISDTSSRRRTEKGKFKSQRGKLTHFLVPPFPVWSLTKVKENTVENQRRQCYFLLRYFPVKILKNCDATHEGVTPLVEKYWHQRYSLFSKYDSGIVLDPEGWFSVTPEEIAIKHAERCANGIVIDCFSGVGGNTIQFAKRCSHVVAIDIDPEKVALAMNNAKVYGVEDNIDFIVGDFIQLAPTLKGDFVFLSPPWGGPSYKFYEKFTFDLLKPIDGYALFQVAQAIAPKVIMFLPRNIDLNQVRELSMLSTPPLDLEIEENYLDNNLKGVTVYFGFKNFKAK